MPLIILQRADSAIHGNEQFEANPLLGSLILQNNLTKRGSPSTPPHPQSENSAGCRERLMLSTAAKQSQAGSAGCCERDAPATRGGSEKAQRSQPERLIRNRSQFGLAPAGRAGREQPAGPGASPSASGLPRGAGPRGLAAAMPKLHPGRPRPLASQLPAAARAPLAFAQGGPGSGFNHGKKTGNRRSRSSASSGPPHWQLRGREGQPDPAWFP